MKSDIFLKEQSLKRMGHRRFTPLESPAACSGDEPRKTSGLLRGEDKIPFGANTGFKAPCETSRWKVEDLLTGFTIKKMEMKDLPQVLTIASSSSNPWSKKMFVEEMQNPISYCFIIISKEIPEQPVTGFICFRNMGDESELLNICVHPQYRKLGFGKILMQFYFDFCIDTDIKRYYLEVNVSNGPAIHFYQLFSYHPFGKRNKFYEGKYDALLMVKET